MKRIFVHWWPAFLMMGLSLLSYLDRQVLAVLSPSILSSAHLNATAYGSIISGFSLAYMLCNPLWGMILDRIGPRRGLFVAVSLWTIASISHAFVAGFAGFLLARVFLGSGEGATFPGVLRTIADTLPVEDQGRGIALGYSGIAAASVLAPVVFIPIADHWNWKGAFLFTGVLGILWLVLCVFAFPASRNSRPRVVGRFELPNFGEKRFWILFTTYAMGAAPLGAVLYMCPLYLRTAGYSQAQLAHVLWIPPLGWECGSFFWAWIVDRIIGPSPRPRFLIWTLGILSMPLIGITSTANHALILGILFFSMFVAGGFVVVALRSSAVWYREERAGLVAGLGAGSWSAIMVPLLPGLGRLFDQRYYGLAFAVVALIPFAGVVGWSLLVQSAWHRHGQPLPAPESSV